MTENKMNELAAKLQAVKDTNAILDTFHRYLQYFSLLHINGVLSVFSERDDVSLEIGEEGIIVGKDELKKHFSFFRVLATKPGVLVYHYSTCPVVEISGDGCTAKLTCFAPGADAMASANMQNWIYGKYYVDLIKDNNSWKLWHVRWFRTFETPVTVGWLDCQTSHDKEYVHAKLKDAYEVQAARQPGSYPENWEYPKHFDPERVNYLLPEPPEAYETWDRMTAMKKTREY